MDRLLFVDDEPFVLRALKRTFELEGFEVVTAQRPADALELLQKTSGFVVIGSDYRMPEMNGAEFLQRARELSPQSYRLLISAVEEFHAAVDSINRGEIYRFVPKPWDRDDLLAIVRCAVDDFHLRRNYQEMTALLHTKNAELSALNKNLEQKVTERTHDLLEALVTALDRRGAESVHSRKVAAFCVRLGRELDLNQADLAVLEQGALIHDVGKIAIPDSILLRNGDLAPQEWEQMKRHPELGYRMLASIPFLDQARRLVLVHHERFDGKGYPLGLSGEQLPVGARIMHVCEAYEAMTGGRSFRAARPSIQAREEIGRCAGTQFDPKVVAAFSRIPIDEWDGIGNAAVPSPAPEESLAALKAAFQAGSR
jgi:response regulator RpfG family c-di-GMP phosphodiesterase